MNKTLYVSDLDGTLMKNDETLSPETVQMINELVEKGLDFTFATARSHFLRRRPMKWRRPRG